MITNHKVTAELENSPETFKITDNENNNKYKNKKENQNFSSSDSKLSNTENFYFKKELDYENKILKEINDNLSILDNSENKNTTYKVSNLSDLLYKLNYNTDIEKIIDTLNATLVEQNKPTFNKNDFNIKLKKEELDKFFKIKSVNPDFSLNLKYSLLSKNLNFNK